MAPSRSPQELAKEQFYGAEAIEAGSKVKALVFSYASPQQLKAAKLEALQLKVQERLKASLPQPPPNPYEGLETVQDEVHAQQETPTSNITETARMRAGGLEQYTALVVPPADKSGTAKVVANGRVQKYQQPRMVGKPSSHAINIDFDLHSDAGSGKSAGFTSSMKANTRLGSDATETHHNQEPGNTGGINQKASSNQSESAGRPRAASASRVSTFRHTEPTPEQEALNTLKRSVMVPFVPVSVNKNLLPMNGLSSTARIVSAVRQSVGGVVMRSLGPRRHTSVPGRVLQGTSDSGVSANDDTQSLVSYTGGSELSAPSYPKAGTKSTVPLVKVIEEDLYSQYKNSSAARAAGTHAARQHARHSQGHSMGAPHANSAVAMEAVSAASQAAVQAVMAGLARQDEAAKAGADIPGFEHKPPATSHQLSMDGSANSARRASTGDVPVSSMPSAQPSGDAAELQKDQVPSLEAEGSVGRRSGQGEGPPSQSSQQQAPELQRQPTFAPQASLQTESSQASSHRQSSVRACEQVAPRAPPPQPRQPTYPPSSYTQPPAAQSLSSQLPPAAYTQQRPAAVQVPPSHRTSDFGFETYHVAADTPTIRQYNHQLAASAQYYSRPGSPDYGGSIMQSRHSFGRSFTSNGRTQGPPMYDWQLSGGPRHRIRPSSAAPRAQNGIITAYASVGGSVQGAGERGVGSRPQSAGAAPAAGGRRHSAGDAALTLLSSFKPPDTAARLAQMASSAAPSRKTTSKDRNGALAWGAGQGQGTPDTSTSRPGASPHPSVEVSATNLGTNNQISTISLTVVPTAGTHARPGKHTDSLAQREAAATGQPPTDLQYRVLEYTAAMHGAPEPATLLNAHAAPAALNTITVNPAVVAALKLNTSPSTALVTRPAANQLEPAPAASMTRTDYVPPGGPVLQQRSSSSTPAAQMVGSGIHAARPASATLTLGDLGSIVPRMRPRPASAAAAARGTAGAEVRGNAQGGAAGSSAVVGMARGSGPLPPRPQSAMALSVSGVPSKRTRPPSAGTWGGGMPFKAVVAAGSLIDEESELLWSASVNHLDDAAGVQITSAGIAIAASPYVG